MRHVAICLDDAHKAHLPIIDALEKRGVKVTIAAPSSWIGKSDHMSWDDLRGLEKRGHEVACHAHDHGTWQRAGQAGDASWPAAEDVREAVKRFHDEGLGPKGFIPPGNYWLPQADATVREFFQYGRRGRHGSEGIGDDVYRMPAIGLTESKLENIVELSRTNEERAWTIYIAHLFEGKDSTEAKMLFHLVELLEHNVKFDTLGSVAEKFLFEVDVINKRCYCQVWTVVDMNQWADRGRVQCSRCLSLERHRSLALLFDQIIPDARLLQPREALLISSDELRRPLENLGWRVSAASPFAPDPNHRDAHYLYWQNGTFDLCAMQHVLPHVRDDVQVLREIRRVLRPGGLLLVEHPLIGTRTKTWQKEGHYRTYGRQDWDELARSWFTLRRIVPLMPRGDLYILER